MARTDHSKTTRRVPRIDVEGRNRTRLRQSLHRGDWDELPSMMPTRVMRRASL